MSNNFDPFIPEWWAMGALAMLNESLVAVPLFNKDFSEAFARGGQIINTRRPHKMTATRKHKDTDIAAQDVSADNIAVPLDQQIYNSFTVHDLDQQWSMADLMSTYLKPAGFALAKMADSIVLAQAAQFLLAGNVTGDPAASRVFNNLVDARALMDTNLAPEEGRNLILNPTLEAKLLKDQYLTRVDNSGSSGALRKGQVGELLNMGMFKTQNLISNTVASGATGATTLTANAAVAVGATTFTTTAQSGVATVANDWVSIAGIPYKVTAVSGSGPYSFTINRAVTVAAASGAVFTVLKGNSISTSYSAGHGEEIVLSSSANQYVPKVGDWVDILGKLYGIVQNRTTNTYLLDRPLEDAVTSSDKFQTVPPGNYSLLAQRDALTIVLRTLAPTKPGTGCLSAVATYNNLGVRAQMWYNAVKQTMQVSLDFLMGVKLLDADMGAVVVS